MELTKLWITLKSHWKIIVVITLIATFSAGIVSKFILPKKYAGITTLMVIPQGSSSVLYTGLVSGQQLTTTYGDLAVSPTIIGEVDQKLHLSIPIKTLSSMIKAKPGANTDLVTITVTTLNPVQAAQIANTIGQQTIKLVSHAEGQKSLQMVTSATPNTTPVSPNTKLNVAVAFALGMMISIGLAFLLEYLNDSLQTEDQAKNVLNLPILGVIPTIHHKTAAVAPKRETQTTSVSDHDVVLSSRTGRRR